MAGLRERKKTRTRDELIEAALTLFEQQGFDATTIDEIAAAVDVSPRTVFRYFASKEDLVFLGQEDENRRFAASLQEAQHADPIDALMGATWAILLEASTGHDQLVRAQRLIAQTPSLRAHKGRLLATLGEQLATELLPGRAPRKDVVQVRMLVAVYLAALDVAMSSWIEAGAVGSPQAEVAQVEALLRRAFPDPPGRPRTSPRRSRRATRTT